MTESGTDRPTDVRVLVGIPTYRRPAALGTLLGLVLEQARNATELGGIDRVVVAVVDNDPGQSARPVVARIAADATALAAHGIEIGYDTESVPGVAMVRNRLLDLAVEHAALLLVFIDDDETPEPGWLTALVDTWRGTGADAVAGAVVPRYPDDMDPWLVAGGFFVRRVPATGTTLQAAPCGNLLLDMEGIGRLGLRFDGADGLTGGEDTRFTTALTRRGGRIVFCSESRVTDPVPAARATRRWVLARAFGHGNGTALQEVRAGAGPRRVLRRARFAAAGLARVGAGTGRVVLGAARRDQRTEARGARLVARGAGMIAGAGGVAYREYAREGARLVTASGAPAWPPSVPAKRVARRAAGVLGSRLASIVRVTTPATVVLTFDDGPDPEVTPALLDLLAEYAATATFFVLGHRAAAHPDLVSRIVAEGHELALHGDDHTRLTRLPVDDALARLASARTDLEGLCGRPVRWVRPPYGASSPRLALGMRRLGLTPVLWSATTWDWKDVPHEARQRKIRAVVAGDVVLAHDGHAGPADGAVEDTDAAPPGVDKPALLRAALADWTGRGLHTRSVGEALATGAAVREVRLPR